VTPAFKKLFKDIGHENDWPLHHPTQHPGGSKSWLDVVYATPWGYRPLMLDILVPKGRGPHPLVVYIHGGAWAAGSPKISNPIYRKMDFVNKLVKAGFAVASINYRFSKEAQFPAQLHDCKAAIRFLRKQAKVFGVDPKRFASFGDSAGGHLASFVGLTGKNKELEGDVGVRKGSSAVQAVVNWFGPTHFLTMAREKLALESWGDPDAADSPESLLVGGAIQKNKAKAKAASPISYVHKASPPTLLQYGDVDRLVPLAQGQALHDAMRAKGCKVTLQVIKGADHCFWGVDTTPIVDDMINFLQGTIGKQA
jgi:acetyl esterase/lipase